MCDQDILQLFALDNHVLLFFVDRDSVAKCRPKALPCQASFTPPTLPHLQQQQVDRDPLIGRGHHRHWPRPIVQTCVELV